MPEASFTAREVPSDKLLFRNVVAQLLHGMFGQTGGRIVGAPTFLPAYLFALSGSDFIVGLARSLQAVGTVITPIVGASLIGHRKKILGVTLATSALMRLQILGLSLTGFLLGAGEAVIGVVAFLFLMGFFQGIAQVTMNSLRAKVVPVNRRGIVSGARNFLAGLTSAGVAYGAGFVIDANLLGNGYSSVFLMAFVITTFGLAALAITVEPRAENVRSKQTVLTTLRAVTPLLRQNPAFARFFMVRALGSFGRMALPFYILFGGTRMETTGATLGLLTTVWMLTSSTANLAWGLLADRLGYKIVLVMTLACWTASHVQLLFVDGQVGMIIFFAIMGMASGGFNQAGQNMVLEFGRPEDIPIRLAASGSAVNLVGTIGPVIGGAIVAATGYVELFVTTIVLQATALGILIVSVPDPRRVARRQ